jgi:hypothetical protein|nr:MAG TPA: hypothetical protein [Caudoviricetes sp.]
MTNTAKRHRYVAETRPVSIFIHVFVDDKPEGRITVPFTDKKAVYSLCEVADCGRLELMIFRVFKIICRCYIYTL